MSEGFVLPQPTDHLGLLRIPGPGLNALAIRFALLSDSDQFSPSSWMSHALTQSVTFPDWWEIDADLRIHVPWYNQPEILKLRGNLR